jgi:hypothetical protein
MDEIMEQEYGKMARIVVTVVGISSTSIPLIAYRAIMATSLSYLS